MLSVRLPSSSAFEGIKSCTWIFDYMGVGTSNSTLFKGQLYFSLLTLQGKPWINRFNWCFSPIGISSIKRSYNILVSQVESNRLSFKSCYLVSLQYIIRKWKREGAVSGSELPWGLLQRCCVSTITVYSHCGRDDCTRIAFSWLHQFCNPFIMFYFPTNTSVS